MSDKKLAKKVTGLGALPQINAFDAIPDFTGYGQKHNTC